MRGSIAVHRSSGWGAPGSGPPVAPAVLVTSLDLR